MLNRIEHLGIAIKSLETSDHLFAKLLGKIPYKQEAVTPSLSTDSCL